MQDQPEKPESDKTSRLRWLYWLAPAAIFCAQALCTAKSTGQIRYEELAESVRNVYWLEHRTIYDGISSNVGWYGTLLAAYQLFGFSLHAAKYVRLALALVSLLCLAELLRRALGERRAAVPLLAAGLSPTLLYFTTFQASFGIDLQYAPICLLLIVSARPERPWTALAQTSLGWLMAMVACMSYPAFVIYLPSLAAVTLFHFIRPAMKITRRQLAIGVVTTLAAFLLPLAAAMLSLRQPKLLLSDPAAGGAGIFRGGGEVDWSPGAFGESLSIVLKDIFITGDSYNFELSRPDFAPWPFAALGVAILLLGGWVFVSSRPLRLPVAAAALLLVLAIIVPNLSGWQSGLRRCTGIPAALYVMLVIVWRHVLGLENRNRLIRRAVLALGLILVLHHVAVYPGNLKDLSSPSRYRYPFWLDVKPTAAESLAHWVAQTEQGSPLVAMNRAGQKIPIRYQEIYATIAGYRLWNGLPTKPILAYDWKTGKDIPLSPRLWEEYYFPH